MSTEEQAAFDEWWSAVGCKGQFMRPGGGNRERPFANHAWFARAALAAERAKPAADLVFMTPVELPDGRIAKMRSCDLRGDDKVAFIDETDAPARTAALPAEKPDAGHPLLQKLVNSIDTVDGVTCWDCVAMYEVRDALAERAKTEALRAALTEAVSLYNGHCLNPGDGDNDDADCARWVGMARTALETTK